MAHEHALPAIIVPYAYGESINLSLVGPCVKEGATEDDTGIVCLDPEAFPSAIEVTLTIRHRSYTWSYTPPGQTLAINHSIAAPAAFSEVISATPAIAILSGTTFRLPLSNAVSGTTWPGHTVTAGTISSYAPAWGLPNNWYKNLTLYSRQLSTGQTFQAQNATTKIVCRDCVLTAYYGLVNATGTLDGKLHAQFRRNVSTQGSVTGVYRVWEGAAYAYYEWTGVWDLYNWSIDEWQLVNSTAYSINRSGWASYKRQLAATDILSLDPTGAFSYVAGSGSNPSSYIFDLARNDIYSATGKTA